MATGDKLVTLDDLKAAYDRLHAEDGALFNAARLIEFVEPDRTESYTGSNSSYVRVGNRFTFNGRITSGYFYRLYGEASHGSSSYSWATKNPGCVTFTAGHTYALTATLISGTMSHASGGIHVARLYKAGTNTNITSLYPSIELNRFRGSGSSRYTEVAIPADATDLTFGVYFYMNNRTDASSATFDVSIYDVTEYNPFNDSAIAPSECVVAKENRTAGDLVLLGGQLFKVTSAIAAGETITTTDISATSVAEEIAALNT